MGRNSQGFVDFKEIRFLNRLEMWVILRALPLALLIIALGEQTRGQPTIKASGPDGAGPSTVFADRLRHRRGSLCWWLPERCPS